MKRELFFLILFFAKAVLHAQDYKTIHQLEYEEHLTDVVMLSEFDPAGKDIIPLQFDKSKSLDVTIFGYLPDWEYQTAKPYLRYDIITHIAGFDFVVDSLGNVSNPSYWPWTDVINTAHTNGVKIILCAVNFTGSQIHYIMTTPTAKQNFFSKVLAKMQQYQLDGINIDFESLLTADRGDVVNGFMADLTAYIKGVVPTAEISFAGPAVNWSSWKLQGLADACDYIFIMGYDFYGSWSTSTGPSAPFLGGSYNIYNTVNTQYAGPTATTPHKLILGVPYFGVKWLSRTGEINSSVVAYVSSTRFTTDQPNSQTYGLQWAANYRVPWYRWQNNDTSWYQVWYDNDSSLGIKYALAQSKNYKGVGMWALGYDKGRNELWDELYERFYQLVPVNLISFIAFSENNTVLLKWTTQQETNNKGFQVFKRNVDSQAGNWELLAFIPAAADAGTQNNYSYRDNLRYKGNFAYQLRGVDYDGTVKILAEESINLSGADFDYGLFQNYPNPFNPETVIEYQINEDSFVNLKIFDVMGNLIEELVSEKQSAGRYSQTFKAKKLPSGIYIYHLTTNKFSDQRSMLLLK
ncbi:MAG: glycosyl hydrolase family 18 protein [Ignavibacteriaceae bacterium]